MTSNPDDPASFSPPEKKRQQRKSILLRIVQLLGILSLVGSVLSFAATEFWVADILAQVTVQYVVLLLMWLVLLVYQRQWKTSSLVLGVVAFNLVPIVPYFLPYPQTRLTMDPFNNGTASLRIAALNVLRTNMEFQSTLDLVLAEKPDLIYLSEVQPAWKDYLEDIRPQYPYQLRNMSVDYTGVVLLSRLPLEGVEVLSLGSVPNPSYDVQVVVDGRRIRIIATHPLPPLGSDLSESRDCQLLALADRFDGTTAELLMGDLNQSPWSPKFRELLLAGELRDASLGYGIGPTLAPLPTWLGGVKVDHFLVNQRVSVADYGLSQIPHSDHHMILLDCQFQ